MTSAPGDESSLHDYLGTLYGDDARRFRCRATSPEAVAAWQARARPELRRLIGLERIAGEVGGHRPRVELDAAERCAGYRRQRGEIETEPGFRIAFWLLIPDGDGPFPIALTPHGHDRRGMDSAAGIAHDDAHRDQIRHDDRDVAVQAVRRGFLAIAPQARGTSAAGIPDRNERHGKRDCRSQFMHAVLAGRSATGERVWDLIRLLDWAAARDDSNAEQVLVMGNSGGGVITLYTSACDERVGCAVVSCSYCSFVGRTGDIHHCDCNAVPGIMRWGEMADVAGLIAPRALCLVHGRNDPLFPPDEVDIAVADAADRFRVVGADDRFAQYYGPGGHRFYAGLMWPFIDKVYTCRNIAG